VLLPILVNPIDILIQNRYFFTKANQMETEEQKKQPRYGTVNFERRKHPRFSVDLPVEYYKLGSLLKHDGKAMNSSQGGLLVYFSEPLQIGQYLRLKIFLSSGSKLRAIEPIAEVTWKDIHLDERGGDYRTGVRFCDISPDDMNKLKKFLLSLSQ
jgi:c-di-GMP-binding flagellar brake protein YcgR